MVKELIEQVPAVPVRRGHALPDVVRPSRRLLGGLLHVHVVAGDREGHVQPVRSRRTCSRRRSPTKYRNTVLAPGGSKPAATLVSDFLGRPFDFKAWERWLNQRIGRRAGPTCLSRLEFLRAPLQADDRVRRHAVQRLADSEEREDHSGRDRSRRSHGHEAHGLRAVRIGPDRRRRPRARAGRAPRRRDARCRRER